MKKLFIITVISLCALLAIGIVSFVSAEGDKVKVTFKAEFTSPVDFPERYGVFGELDGSPVHTITCEKGTVLDERRIPSRLFCTGDCTCDGWDTDPYGYEVTEDVTFTITIHNDGTVPAFFRAKDEKGEDMLCMTAKSITEPDKYMDYLHYVTVFVKEGEKLEEGVNIPERATIQNGMYVYVPDGITPEAQGHVMTEPMEFICNMKPMNPDDVQQFTVTYKAEFTTPMDVPEEFYLMTFKEYKYYPGSIIDESEIPKIRFLGDGMTFEGWETEPVGTAVHEDMTFTAKFNNDGGIPIFYKAIDEDKEPIPVFADPKDYEYPSYYSGAFYRTYVAVVKAGKKLTETDIPAVNYQMTYQSGWDEDPLGYEALEAHTFTYNYNYYYRVRFSAIHAGIDEEQYVHRGEAAKAPEVPEVKGWIFTGWDSDFSHVTEDMDIRALMYRYGDVNMDNVINTSDAVKILRHCADMEILTETGLTLADADMSGAVDTKDAVKVLRVSAGIEN